MIEAAILSLRVGDLRTLRLARELNATGELITVDPDVMAYSISSSLYEQAGVRQSYLASRNT